MYSNWMQWDDLHTFLEIARQGSLSGAARALRLTQPTVGRRLAAMEETLGAKLLQRTPGGFVLTPIGESVLANAERMEQEALAAERLIFGGDIKMEGDVRVTTVDTLATAFVTPALVALQKEHPDINVELAPASQALSLARREADIAVRVVPFNGNQIVARKIGAIALNFFASPDYLERADMSAPRLISVLDDQSHLPEATWIEKQFPTGTIRMRSNSREVLFWSAVSGGGVALLPRFLADQDDRLVRVLPASPDLRRDIWLGVHSDMRQTPRIRATMDALIAAFEENAHRLDPEGQAGPAS
ncbi:LysR family transcriptional regulator [Hyphomonas sp.]|uniref:LysR family transcriptional regulator n=1 Tax=Hyphomonas TaxID=85 RepID=UPI0032429E27